MVGQFGVHARSEWIDNEEHHLTIKPSLIALFVGIVMILLAFLKPGIWGFDGNDMLFMSQSLILKGNLTIPEGAGGVLGADGQYYSIRYPLLSIVATPLVALGLWLGNVLNLPVNYTSATCALVVCILLTAGSAVLTALLTLRLGGNQRNAYLAALGFTLGTTALTYSREFFAEPLLSFMSTLALYWALGRSNREHFGVSILAALVVIAKPAGIVVGPPLAFYFLCKRYAWVKVISPFVGTCVGFGLYLLYNYMRFGSFFSSGQDSSRFTADGFFARLFGLILSPGAGGGLFWYCPPTILALVGLWWLIRQRNLAWVAVAGMFFGYWVLHAFWEFGGWNWGPRFLVPTLPALMALTGLLERRWRGIFIGLVILGFVMNAPSLLTFYQRYYAEAADAGQLKAALALWGDPANMPFFNVWGATWRQLQEAFSTPVQDIIASVGRPPELGQLSKAELLRIVAVWWWFLPAAGIPIWIGVLLALGLVGTGIWFINRGWQALIPAPVKQPT
jgi:hypothetical protein